MKADFVKLIIIGSWWAATTILTSVVSGMISIKLRWPLIRRNLQGVRTTSSMMPLEHTPVKGVTCSIMMIITIFFGLMVSAVTKKRKPPTCLEVNTTHRNRTLPAAGDEYMIMMCRSTYATGGFADKHGVACTSSGGSILVESHGTKYGPVGQ